MDTSFINKLIQEVNSLDLVFEPSFLVEKKQNEEEIGLIKDDETKKLFYYLVKINRNKMLEARKVLNGYMVKDDLVCEADKVRLFINKIEELIEEHDLLHVFLRRNLEREIPSSKGCLYVRVTKGWKVVKINCNNCKKISTKIKNQKSLEDEDELFTKFDKFKKNANLN